MEKIWNIDDNEFFAREDAKEFLAMAWAREPEEYLSEENITSSLDEYLQEHKKCYLDNWLLKMSKATEQQLKEMQNTLKQFVAEFLDEVVENVVDDWLTEEIEEE